MPFAVAFAPLSKGRYTGERSRFGISFTRHFYRPQPLRTLEDVGADILAIEKEAEGLLDGLLKGGTQL